METEPDVRLTYHGYDHPAEPCGTYKGAQVYLLRMASSCAIVKRGAKREGSAHYGKAKGLVLHAGTSVGPDAAIIKEISFDGEFGERARTWALEQCKLWLTYTERYPYYAERCEATRALLAVGEGTA